MLCMLLLLLTTLCHGSPSALPGFVSGDDERLARKTRIVLPEVKRAFYRSGGRHLAGRKVYLTVDSTVLRAEPEHRPSSRGTLLVFENRSVPLVVPARNCYWRQVSRHLDGAGSFSIRGRLKVSRSDPRRRVHLYVESIKRTPGTWR